MNTFIFDIETVGENFDTMDKTTQEVLTRWIKKESETIEDYEEALSELKDRLGFSPLVGEIIAVGLLGFESNEGAVYFQAPDEDIKDFNENSFIFRKMSEKEMLEKFWDLAKRADKMVSFNGRSFDAPFLIIRSAIHKIKPTIDLMPYRYGRDSKHIDLLDQLTFYGALRRRGNLHLWSRAFDIKSPKSEGITGDDIGRLFKEKKYVDIAKYNVGDLIATKELYRFWKEYISF